MIHKASILIIDPRGGTRTRLTEVLRNIVIHLEVESTGLLTDGFLRMRKQSWDAVLISSDYSISEIRQLMDQMQARQETKIIVVTRATKQDAEFLALLFLTGVNGFLLEPYSANQLTDLIALTQEIDPSTFEGAFKGQAAFNILLTEVVFHLDALSEQIAKGKAAHGRELKALKRVTHMIQKVATNDLPAYAAALCKAFENVPPSKSADLKKNTKQRMRAAPHPGKQVREQLARRGLDVAKVAGLLRMDQAELEAFLAETGTITMEFAQGLSRVLGETAQYWVSMQNRYNRFLASKNADEPASGQGAEE